MATILSRRFPVRMLWQAASIQSKLVVRPMSMVPSPASADASSQTTQPETTPELPRNTHFKITLRRSAISLGDAIKGTLVSLGIHRRFQTVYHRHSPEVAGKILRVKELVEVENVPENLVRTKQQQRQDRKAPRGYKVIGSKQDRFMHV